MKIEAQHVLMGVCALAAAVSEGLTNYVSTGNQLPFHLTAGAALAAGAVLGAVSKSILTNRDQPTITIETDVLKAIVKSLSEANAVPGPMHLALLDAVGQNLIQPGTPATTAVTAAENKAVAAEAVAVLTPPKAP